MARARQVMEANKRHRRKARRNDDGRKGEASELGRSVRRGGVMRRLRLKERIGVKWTNGIQRGTLLRGAAAGAAGTTGEFQVGST